MPITILHRIESKPEALKLLFYESGLFKADNTAKNDLLFYKRDNGQYVLEQDTRADQIIAKVTSYYRDNKQILCSAENHSKYIKT